MRSLRNPRIAGSLLIAIGIAVNGWTLGPLATDGRVSPWTGILILFLFQLPLILTGAIVVTKQGSAAHPRWLDAALLLTSMAFATAAAEYTLGRFAPSPAFVPAPRAFTGEFENRPNKHFVADPATGWRLRPNHEFRWWIDGHPNVYRSNAEGFRSDREFSRAMPGDRIVVVGDSFAFGTGVDTEESFAALLDARLGDGDAVLNLAMPGFGLDQMWMSVRHQALPMNPSLVILAFIDENLDRSLTAYRRVEGFNKPTFEREDGGLRPQRPGDRPHPAIRFLESHSAIYAALRHLAREIGYRARFGDWWLRNEAILEAVIRDCRESGVPLLLVRLPMKNWREFPSLHRLAEREGANLLDLGSRRMRPSYDVHFLNDGHINSAGHAFVAGHLHTWISDRLPAMAGPGEPPESVDDRDAAPARAGRSS